MIDNKQKFYDTGRKFKPLVWHLIFYTILFLSLPFIAIFNIYEFIPNYGFDLYLMPKLNKFLIKYSLEDLKQYNLILWKTIFIWFFLLLLIFVVGQFLNKWQNKRKLSDKLCKKYFKIFFLTLMLPVIVSLIFLFGDLKSIFSSSNNIDYVNNLLVEEYVFRQSRLFLILQAPFSIFFIMFTIDVVHTDKDVTK